MYHLNHHVNVPDLALEGLFSSAVPGSLMACDRTKHIITTNGKVGHHVLFFIFSHSILGRDRPKYKSWCQHYKKLVRKFQL